MKSSASKIQLSGYDELFQTNGEGEISDERVQEIPLSELFPFKDHPFQVRDDEAMRETADSIAKHGVLVPGIVRPRQKGGYEIVSGHRRKRGSELAGRDTMPVLVRALDDDDLSGIRGKGDDGMNKRIRKKHIRKALRELIAAYEKFEAARKRAFRRALQDVADAHLEPYEEIQCYLSIASLWPPAARFQSSSKKI